MEVASIKKSYVLNLINTVTGLLFPLITFPYASRILLAEGIGKVQFFQAIVDYIILLTSLGIPLYAVRELARIRDNVRERNKLTSEIIFLHAALTVIGYLIVYIVAITVTKIRADIPLFLLLSTGIFFNAIGVQWFYQAIEDFKYITIRSLIVRILSAAALFIFVKDKSDLMYYAAIHVAATVGNNIFNFLRLRKYLRIDFYRLKELQFTKHLKPALKLFVLNLIISIYAQLDSIMLGFMKNEEAVGFYAGAIRMTKMVLGIVTSLGSVLLPRFSNLISTGREGEFIQLGNKAIGFTIAMTFPMAIGIILLADPIIMLFCGPGFVPAILTLQILSPIIVFIGLSSLIGIQILYPQSKENFVIFATLIGAVINFSINMVLIPRYSQYGAAAATVTAEFMVTAIMIYIGRKYLPFSFINRQNMNYLVASALMGIAVWQCTRLGLSTWLTVIAGISAGCSVYFGYLIIRKDPLYLTVKQTIANLINQISK